MAVEARAPLFDTPDGDAELNELLTERDNLRTVYTDLRSRLDEAKIFGSNRDGYEEELVQQSERLKTLNLIPEIEDGIIECPLCSSPVSTPTKKLEILKNELAEISGRISTIRTQNPRLNHTGKIPRQSRGL